MAAIFTGPGIALATLLHTLGAIGYLGGIGMFISWRRAIMRGDHHPSVLGTAAALTYLSIAANLLGGFIRTYQPGHPSLTAFLTEPWVAVMAIKHVILFTGMGAAIVLLEIQAPRLRRAWKNGTMDGVRTGPWVPVVVASIVLSAALGGVSAVLPIGDDAPADDALIVPARPVFAPPVQYQGTAEPSSASRGTFQVPDGTRAIEGNLTVTAPALGALTIALIDPTGARTEASTETDLVADDQAAIRVDAPIAGTWQYEVQGTARAAWTLDLTFPSRIMLIERTLELDQGFHEIDLEVPEGVVLSWDWSAQNTLDWNIHTHTGAGTLVEGETGRAAGTYTTSFAGDHSFEWRGSGRLTYAVWGEFTETAVYP